MSIAETNLATDIDEDDGGTDPILLRNNATIGALETIPLPREKITAHEAFSVHVDDMDAWPDQPIEFHFEYNRYMARWIFEAYHHGYDRLLFDGRSVATLGRAYSEYPALMAHFIAPNVRRQPARIDASNLGRSVYLAVAPGPAGGRFPDAAGLTREQEDAILGRFASDYPVAQDWLGG